jgi:alpha-ketoglutarate-dependent taurine dioxygenase
MPSITQASRLEVSTRFLRPSERPAVAVDLSTPLVFEPVEQSKIEWLESYLRENGGHVLQDVATHGAVLLRGFPVETIAQFEQVITAIPGMRGIDQMFMSEPGRKLVEGTKFVFYTSAAYKTGGTMDFGAFHTENYYVPDVPRFICFYCVKPPRMGGETGLLNTASLYKELPEDLQRKLESRSFLASLALFSEVIERYGCSAETLEGFCTEEQLRLESSHGEKAIVSYKAAVMVHPTTGERSLCIHFPGELNKCGLEQALIDAFSADYSGSRWFAHRLYWRYRIFSRIKGMALRIAMPLRLAVPWSVIFRFLFSQIRWKKPFVHVFRDARVGDMFSAEDVKNVAILIRKNYSSFRWQRRDVLIIDNLKLAHAGMPGFGSRELKAIMCNPIVMPSIPGGTFSPADGGDSKTLGAKLSVLGKIAS